MLCHLIQDQSMHINSTDPFRSTVLHLAILERREDMVLLILGLGGNLDMQDSDGNTALHLGVKSGIYRITRHLLLCGAKRNIKNSTQQIPSELCQSEEISKLMKRRFPSNSIRYLIVVLAFFTLQSLVFAISDEKYDYATTFTISCGVLFIVNMFLFLFLCFRDPGYEKKSENSLQVRSK